MRSPFVVVLLFLVYFRTFVTPITAAGGDVPPGTVSYCDQEIDHFAQDGRGTFSQRYVTCSAYSGVNSPLFLYTGNEGDIFMFYNNSGFVFEQARKYNAFVVFIEHRYYGKSLPFGDSSFTTSNLEYLTVEQALEDFVCIVKKLQEEHGLSRKVVAFGGSYGGMLSAFIRFKYPDVISGAISSSAPVRAFQGHAEPTGYNAIITRDFAQFDGCAETCRSAFQELADESLSLDSISDALKLCEPLKIASDRTLVYEWLSSIITFAGICDYPYPESFIVDLPAWPIEQMCDKMKEKDSGDKILSLALVAAGVLDVYFNTSGRQKCFNISQSISPTIGMRAWNYQACTQMIMPYSSNGKTDMFWDLPWNLTDYVSMCKDKYGSIKVDPYWIPTKYNFSDPTLYSNIVFSNGVLDPWMNGGVTWNVSSSVPSFIIERGAHHLDLRASNPRDPESVIAVRNAESEYIFSWISR